MSGTRRYGLIGNPVSQSLSPLIHGCFARELGLPVEYSLLEVGEDAFAGKVRDFAAAGGKGLNVTMPYKAGCLDLADNLSHGARQAGAANTLRFEEDGTVSACNTDGPGLLLDIKKRHRQALTGARVLLIGAGGAVAGALAPLLRERPASLCVANRTEARAQALRERLAGVACENGARMVAVGLDGLLAEAPYQVVIHATGASFAEVVPDSRKLFSETELAYDMAYGPSHGGFATAARLAGVPRVANGLGMVVEQAALSFAYWEGKLPATEPVLATLARGGACA